MQYFKESLKVSQLLPRVSDVLLSLLLLPLHWVLGGEQGAGKGGTPDPPTQAHLLNPGSSGLHGDVPCCLLSGRPAWVWALWKREVCVFPAQIRAVIGPSLLLKLHIPLSFSPKARWPTLRG